MVISTPDPRVQILALLIPAILIIILFSMVFGKSKSRRYRERLSDLYVSAKIRQLAKEDNLDLKEELKLMLESIKDSKKYFQSLDETIEMELQDRVMGLNSSTETKDKK